jgi:threonylcarbamoyladenosine tRNA methylthiotransferase CDKAL1
MAGLLHAHGYQLVERGEDADLWVLNSCTVKNPSEASLNNAIDRAKALGKHLVVAGCVPQASPSAYGAYSILGVQQIDRVVEVVEETLKGHTVRLLKERKTEGRKLGGAALALPKIRRNALIEIVPINTGCLNQCTYCKTKHARGDLGSYHPDEIVARVAQVLDEGVVEVWLTSEDTGAYGRDIGATLPDLLLRIADVMRPGTRLRLGMTNPPYILEHLAALVPVFMHPRVYRFLHVPVQAASDRVLAAMKREYTRADFCDVVDYLREHVPGITIATDVICGFPTETAEEFDETLALLAQYEFPVVNISQVRIAADIMPFHAGHAWMW